MKKGPEFDSDYDSHLLNIAEQIAAGLTQAPQAYQELHSHLDTAEAIRLISEPPPDRTGDQFLKRELLYRLS